MASSSFDEDSRVIIHLDLDCFYCQVESQRLGIPRDRPLAVRQWQGLIAVNYAARAEGITRHMTAPEALKICPSIVLAHVETLGAGGVSDGGSVVFGSGAGAAARAAAAGKEASTSTAAPPPMTPGVPLKSDRKASLLRYRDASSRVLQSLRSFFPQGTVIEKASIDEFYVDATAAVEGMLSGRRGDDDVDAASAAVAEAAKAPGGVVVVQGFEDDDESDNSKPFPLDPTIPQDARLAAGAALAASARASVLKETGYTCSAGISHNKLLSKVASAKFKPNRQAVVPRSGSSALLKDLPLSKLPGFGGKMGAAVEAAVARAAVAGATAATTTTATTTTAITVGDLAALPIDAIHSALGGDRESAMSVWLSARGESTSRVVEKAAPKSLMAAKSLDQATSSKEVLLKWIWILSEELAARLEADGRPPRVVSLHYRCRGMQAERSVSGQAPRATMKKAREVGGGGGGNEGNSDAASTSPRSAATVSVPVPPDASAIAASAEALLNRAMNALVAAAAAAANGGGGPSSASSSSRWPLVNRLCLTAGDFAPPVATGAASIARFFTSGGSGNKVAAAAPVAVAAASVKKQQQEEEGAEEAKAPPPSGLTRFMTAAKEEKLPGNDDDGDDYLSKVDVREQERILREIERSRSGGGGGSGGGGRGGSGSANAAAGGEKGGGGGGKGTKRKASNSTTTTNQPAPQQRTIASMFGGVNKK